MELLTVDEVGKIIGKPRDAVQRSVRKGKIMQPIEIGGERYWHKEQFEEWVLRGQRVDDASTHDPKPQRRRPGRPRKNVVV